jgi:ornithine carbamoyltransferase
MKLTTNAGALYMHCLPADISGVSCAQGEVSKKVFERYRLATYAEAGFKPFVIAALVYLTRIQNPARSLQSIIRRNITRVI